MKDEENSTSGFRFIKAVTDRHARLAAIFLLLAIVLIFFCDVLFLPGSRVLSLNGGDLASQFVFWRQFGFDRLREGSLPLWNPYLNSGTPFLGGFQSALLYPPNWIYLFLPLAKALNLEMAAHLFLAGVFMFLWGAWRGLGTQAALLSALLLMFGQGNYLHLYAGHLTLLDASAWSPLILAVLDRHARTRDAKWIWIGGGAVALQILAGHPQTVFATAIAGMILVAGQIMREGKSFPALGGCLAIYAIGSLLSAVQLFSGLAAGAESSRGGGGMSLEEAGQFSFPPENFLTLVAPWFFGDNPTPNETGGLTFWGRAYFWETSFFIGVIGLALAGLGAAKGERSARTSLRLMVLLLVILAMGKFTPLFRFLHAFVPGFDRFRGSAKFIGVASIPLALLAGLGFDCLQKGERAPMAFSIGVFIFGAALALAGFAISHSSSFGAEGFWGRWIARICATGETYLPARESRNLEFIARAGAFAARSLTFSAAILGFFGAVLLATHRNRPFAHAIWIMAVAEILAFARSARPAFDLEPIQHPKTFIEFRRQYPGDYRILKTDSWVNLPMAGGLPCIAGYDPQISRRYQQFLQFALSQPDPLPLLRILRCRFVFQNGTPSLNVFESENPSLPAVLLVSRYSVSHDAKETFERMTRPSFDPASEVILESEPDTAPDPAGGNQNGRLKVQARSDDYDISADLDKPAICLITDAYSRGWRAVPYSDSDQKSYNVMPADHVIRAIPVGAGHHHFRVEYAPFAYRLGKWVSFISALAYVGCVSLFRRIA